MERRVGAESRDNRKSKLLIFSSGALALAGIGSFIFGAYDDDKVTDLQRQHQKEAERLLPSPSDSEIAAANTNIESLLKSGAIFEEADLGDELQVFGVEPAQDRIAQSLDKADSLDSRLDRNLGMVLGGVLTAGVGSIVFLIGASQMRAEIVRSQFSLNRRERAQ